MIQITNLKNISDVSADGMADCVIDYYTLYYYNRSRSLRGNLNTEHNISREPVKVNAHLIRYEKMSNKYSSRIHLRAR